MKYLILNNSRRKIRVSDRDFSKLRKYSWYLTYDGYAITSVNGKVFGIARMILNTPKGKIADHKDGDTLNNSRRNLRNCSTHESSQNRRGWSVRKSNLPKGVFYDRSRGKYRAVIEAHGKRRMSPRFSTPKEAAMAYDHMSRKHHGEFGRTNF